VGNIGTLSMESGAQEAQIRSPSFKSTEAVTESSAVNHDFVEISTATRGKGVASKSKGAPDLGD
jgi:hypothetical protein